ncbi:sodium ion-translocating decarboxylase subunit beta [Chloroflexota bacterium]
MLNIPIWEIFQGIYTLFISSPTISIARVCLILLGIVLLYLGYKKILEGLIMIPMGIGMIAINAGVMVMDAQQVGTLFLDPMISEPASLMNALQIYFLQPIYTFTFSNALIAALVFMGIGAITDIDYLLAKPLPSMLLAVCAEFGTIMTLPIAIAMGFTPAEAASIAIVGGADGPMVLFASIQLAPHLFVPISIVAYVYLSLCYAGYPYLIKLMVPKGLRGKTMNLASIPQVARGEKFTFAIVGCAVLCLLFPVAAPLFASFFVGLAIKESGIARLQEFLAGPLLYGSTFFLAFVLGCLLSAETILDPKVALLLVLGIIALLLSGIGGLLGGLAAYKISGGKINPLVGIAAVSCVPTTAKVAQKCAFKANKQCMIMPFAMGACVAGVITTAIITGIYITGIPFIG